MYPQTERNLAMQNVTRTMTEYEVTAYSVCESDGEVGLNVVAECTAHSLSLIHI